MSILITGDMGYIGTNLTAGMEYDVGCDLKNEAGEDYRRIRGETYDTVVHLAASVSVTESFPKMLEYLDNNWNGVADFLQRNKVGRFVFVSTGGALYGNRRGAKEEDAAIKHCLSPYATSKFLAEEAVRKYAPNHCILRLANVYGGDCSMRGEAAVHAHFTTDDPIVVYGGDQTRDFVHVDAVCNAIRVAAAGTMVGTFNIGSGIETRIMQLAEEFAVSRGVDIVTKPKREGEVDFISLNCAKAKDAGLL